ncbi:MAG: zinc metalloprotease, partial [Flavobacteriales bacterium]|nr:zinc metalloprotease [Flavobacteriales bacterium]
MKNKLKKILLTFLFFSSLLSFSQIRNCGTMEHLEFLKSQDPLLEERMQKNEDNLQRWIDNQPESSNPTIITIPVVVHVVYYNSNENISTTQVQSQIDILNEDFRRLNSDASNTPSAFQSVAADCEIEFCLASTDPNGNSTTGITRTSTSQSSFSTNDGVKYSSSGGIDAWNTSEYLNIWVCDISGGILGYAQFPGGNSSSDGIVCDYAYFGNTGTATSPFHLGRTATHEVGHYLNLRHIWGDANCGNDQCNDTPTQQSSNYGCPNFPSTSNCSGNGSNGDMFMNYMDYTDDACMNMFSQDQKTRMIAAINTYRSGLLSSNGCQGSGYGCTNSSAYNYDPNATIDDGSCCYVAGCTDISACNYDAAACYDDGSCQLPDGCTDPTATNYDPNATCDDGSCCFGGGQLLINITTANYPSETSWDLVNQSGVVVASINAGDLTSNATNYSWSI